jgi:hypothetical protein
MKGAPNAERSILVVDVRAGVGDGTLTGAEPAAGRASIGC